MDSQRVDMIRVVLSRRVLLLLLVLLLVLIFAAAALGAVFSRRRVLHSKAWVSNGIAY